MSEPLNYISIVNFEKFQHYKFRKPPWIRLYRDILEDERFFGLTDTERYHLIGLFIIASQHNNKIPNNPDWLKHQLRTKGPISLKPLIASGWLAVCEHDASAVLAECKQNLTTEYSSSEKSREIHTVASPLKSAFGKFGNVMLKFDELENLQTQFGDSGCCERIEALSEYIASKGKKYSSHYATILNWDRKNGSNGNGAHGSGFRRPKPGEIIA